MPIVKVYTFFLALFSSATLVDPSVTLTFVWGNQNRLFPHLLNLYVVSKRDFSQLFAKLLFLWTNIYKSLFYNFESYFDLDLAWKVISIETSYSRYLKWVILWKVRLSIFLRFGETWKKCKNKHLTFSKVKVILFSWKGILATSLDTYQ